MTDSCSVIQIGIESNDPIFDPIVGAVGGVIGGIFGLICGILLTKFCCAKKLISLLNTTNSGVGTSSSKSIKSYETSQPEAITAQKSRDNLQKESVSADHELNIERRIKNDQSLMIMTFSKAVRENTLMEAVSISSFEDMLENHIRQTFSYFSDISLASWQSRCVCIFQIFKLISNDYVFNNVMSKSDESAILQDVEMELCQLLRRVEDSTISHETNNEENVHNKMDSWFSDYQKVLHNFECKLLELIGFKDAAMIHEVLVKCFRNIEINVKRNQKHQIQTAIESFRRDLLVLQAYHSGRMTLKESMKKRRHYYEMMLSKLLESDRLSDEESDSLWKNVKEEVETTFDNVFDDLASATEELKRSSLQQREKDFASFQSLRSKALERFMTDDVAMSPSQKIHAYFTLVTELQSQETKAQSDFTKKEVYQINKMQKKFKTNLQDAYEDMQERFCETLFKNGVLNEKEAQVFLNEITMKNKRAAEDMSTINQIQTKIIDREVSLLRSFEAVKKSLEEEDWDPDALEAVKKKLKEDEVKFSKNFTESQLYLTEEDCDAIVDEYTIYTMLFDNEEELSGSSHCFRDDMDLLTAQVTTLLRERQEDRLSSDEDVDNLVKKLEKQRNDFGSSNDRLSLFSSSQLAVVNDKRVLLCDFVADSLISNLLPEMKKLKKKDQQLKIIKNFFANGASQSESSNREMQALAEYHQHRLQEIESHLRHEHELKVQILKDKFGADHALKVQRLQSEVDSRPLSASSLSASDLLERLLGQERNKREIERMNSDFEATLMSHIYIFSLDSHEKLQSALQDLDKDMLCKFAKATGMKRNNFIQSMKDALTSAGKNEKKFVSEVMQFWEKSSLVSGGHFRKQDDAWGSRVATNTKRTRRITNESKFFQ